MIYIKISKKSQLILLRNINPFLQKQRIPDEVLYEIGYILNYERTSKCDYIALFLKPLKKDTSDVLDELKLYPETYELPDNNFVGINVKEGKHPMKRHRIWTRRWIFSYLQTEQKVFP